MKKVFLSLIFAPLLLLNSASAQHFDIGATLGTSNYIGDLSLNSTKMYLKESNFSGGVHVRFNMNPLLSFKLAANYAGISGTDENARIQELRNRNLSFASNIFEGMFAVEVNIPGFQPYGLNQPFSPYIYAGVGYTSFSPRAFYEDQWYDLQPLQTEGVDYKKSTFSIPFGLGVKFAVSDKFSIGLDFGARYAFTDYLDDVSGHYPDTEAMGASGNIIGAALSNRAGEFLGADNPEIPVVNSLRGDTKLHDMYFIFGLTVAYHFLDNGLVRTRTRNRNRIGCQRF
jgi:opacity protein-like surface antigen